MSSVDRLMSLKIDFEEIPMPFTCELCPKDKPATAQNLQGLASHVRNTHKMGWPDYVKQHGGMDKVKASGTTTVGSGAVGAGTGGGGAGAGVGGEGTGGGEDESLDDGPPKPRVGEAGKGGPKATGVTEDADFESRVEDFLKKKGITIPQMPPGDGDLRGRNEASEVSLNDPSLILTRFWLRAKNAVWFDLVKNHAFGQPPLNDFPEDGNISDFLNLVIEDYFKRVYNAGLGVIRREML